MLGIIAVVMTVTAVLLIATFFAGKGDRESVRQCTGLLAFLETYPDHFLNGWVDKDQLAAELEKSRNQIVDDYVACLMWPVVLGRVTIDRLIEYNDSKTHPIHIDVDKIREEMGRH